jgi:hypothetical protein
MRGTGEGMLNLKTSSFRKIFSSRSLRERKFVRNPVGASARTAFVDRLTGFRTNLLRKFSGMTASFVVLFEMTRKRKKTNGIPAFAGMTALLLLVACTQEEVKLSAKQALINTCKSMRDCTVNENDEGGR